jgi:hypothetical protein
MKWPRANMLLTMAVALAVIAAFAFGLGAVWIAVPWAAGVAALATRQPPPMRRAALAGALLLAAAAIVSFGRGLVIVGPLTPSLVVLALAVGITAVARVGRRPLLLLAAATLAGSAGAAAAIASVVRLGWRRHGADPTDLAFLHPEIVTNPSDPAWTAHIGNLALMALGLILALAALVATALAWRAANPRVA